jgi:hypothetical protein
MPHVKELKQHKLLLDTHVWIWIAQGNTIVTPSTRKAIERAKEQEHLLISPISISVHDKKSYSPSLTGKA